MHSGVGAVDNVNITAIVRFHIIGLNRHLAAVLTLDLHATLIRVIGDRGDEKPHFLWLERITNIQCPNSAVEIRYGGDFVPEYRCETFVGGM